MARFCWWVVAGLLSAGSATGSWAQSKEPVTSDRLRPSADALLDCKDAPVDAVIHLPQALTRWATIYCTTHGHVFSFNDRHFATIPGSGIPLIVNAAAISGRLGPVGHSIYFVKAEQRPVMDDEISSLLPPDRPDLRESLKGGELQRIDLVTNTGSAVSMIAKDASNEDLFWVYPLRDNRLSQVAFFVVSQAYLSRKQ